jgi:proton-dependent oligopeptide transporter, POT family
MFQEQKSIPSLLLLLFVECWERFSYYGMRALLVLYLTSSLGFSDPKAYAIYALFAAIGYGIPPLAGILADRYVGFQKMIIIGAIIMCIGHLFMSFTFMQDKAVYLGLSLIAVGTGFFKGNVTNLLGTIYDGEKANSAAKDKGFTLFYIAINIGMGLSSIACGYFGNAKGWHYGFGLAGVGMLIGLLVFLKYRYILGNHGLHPNSERGPIIKNPNLKTWIYAALLSVCSWGVIYNWELSTEYFPYFGLVILAIFIKLIFNCSAEERSRILLLMTLIVFLVCFYAIEMQLGSLINLFTDRNVDRVVFGYEIPASILQGINPFTIIIIGSMILNLLSSSSKHSPLPRFAIGLFLSLLCFVAIYAGCVNAVNGKANILYLFLGIFFMSVVELFIAPLLQSLFVTLSPFRYRGFMMGIYMIGWSYSNLSAVILSKFMSIPQESLNNPIASMEIYREGFFTILLFNLGVFLTFLLVYPLLNKLVKKHYSQR